MKTGHRSQMTLRTNLDWYDWYKVRVLGYAEALQTSRFSDAYRNDTGVVILATAVKDVKRAALDILADQYNITMPDRPLVSIAAPSFMRTTIEPEPCEDRSCPDCETLHDE